MIIPSVMQITVSIEVEHIQGKGEDSAAGVVIPERAALIAALDGCGGAGARQYSIADNWTGARIASNSCAQAVIDWFYENSIDRLGIQAYPKQAIASSLKQALYSKMKELMDCTASENRQTIVSKLIKPFPTTISVMLVSHDHDNTRCLTMWAGDSRGYILSENGLHQVTIDDLKQDIDPFDNIEIDGILSNVVSGQPFQIHVRDISIKEKCLLLVATDGCFGYLRSPMEFEYVLLSTLLAARSLLEWQDLLSKYIGDHAADDYTLQTLAIGFETFEQIQSYYKPTFSRFCEAYGECINLKLSRSDLKRMWINYKRTYMWESDREDVIQV